MGVTRVTLSTDWKVLIGVNGFPGILLCFRSCLHYFSWEMMVVSQNESWQLSRCRRELALWNICGITPASHVTVRWTLTVLLVMQKWICRNHRSWFTPKDYCVNLVQDFTKDNFKGPPLVELLIYVIAYPGSWRERGVGIAHKGKQWREEGKKMQIHVYCSCGFNINLQ